MSYAVQTEVSVYKSRSELEQILSRYGASAFGYMADEDKTIVAFRAHGKAIRFFLPMPPISDFIKDGRGSIMNPAMRTKRREQACRSRWRALCLCVKAKLEAVECGITSF